MTIETIPPRFGLKLRTWLARRMARKVAQGLSPDVEMETGRKIMDAAGDRIPMDKSVVYADVRLAGLRTLVFGPKHPRKGQLLYLHGGGYCRGSAYSHRPFVSRLAAVLNMKTRAPDYRLAPEHPCPAAIEDALAAYRDMRKGMEGPLIVAGDSAGGGLVLALTLKLKELGEALPDALILYSPWTDLTVSGPNVAAKDATDPMLKSHWLGIAADMYGGDLGLNDPLCSPLFGDFSGFPPTLIQTGTDEVLLDDTTRLAERMEAAGVNVHCQLWTGMWHVFPLFQPLLPEGRMAGVHARSWLDAVLNA
ncbi:MAG: hydrolase [Hyphobacterium sp.]|nr:MAG: hydrolase [Hyphobacterium sp.]